MARVSHHVRQRVLERMPGIETVNEALLINLRMSGRTPNKADFCKYGIAKITGRAYRIFQYTDQPYMLIIDQRDGEFITVLKLKEVQGG